ncbi:MAG: hypothetical protein ABIY70_08695 [Capsulimonas sp.]|uniref:hypothetical protein n=1 Tax=Capsulimonas sp. TaxID=2494211 RepID=UPI0032673676
MNILLTEECPGCGYDVPLLVQIAGLGRRCRNCASLQAHRLLADGAAERARAGHIYQMAINLQADGQSLQALVMDEAQWEPRTQKGECNDGSIK